MTSFRTSFATKDLVCKLERAHFGVRYALVVDEVLFAKMLDLVRQAGRVRPGKFRNGIDVDVERVEKEAAVGGIGARVLRPVDEQGVQRVEPDAGGTQVGG